MHQHHLDTTRRSVRATALPIALAALLAIAATTQPAQAADFAGTGIVESTGPLDGYLQPFLATSNAGYTFAGTSGWSLYAPFVFDFSGVGSGSFDLNRGEDRLFGTLSTQLLGSTSFALTYSVLGGAGQFAGATGGGTTLVTLTETIGSEMYRYSEIGQIAVVPEPAGWALLVSGGLLLAARRRWTGAQHR